MSLTEERRAQQRRDIYKRQAEAQVAEAVRHLKRAWTLYTQAECPTFADHVHSVVDDINGRIG